jgi:NAD dependent epimerase/dehydratase
LSVDLMSDCAYHRRGRDGCVSYAGKRVIVTGADGFIGSHVVEELIVAGARVTALAAYNSFDSVGWLGTLATDLAANVEIIRGDVRDSAFMMRAIAGNDSCFHLAALIAIPYSYAAARSYVDTNVVGTLNVLEAVRSHGLSRLVHTSTSEVYGSALVEPMDEQHPLQGQSPYSASKIGADMMAEAYARSFGTPVVTLRPFNTFGPRQSERAVIPTIIRQTVDPNCDQIRLGDLTPKRDFTFVTDTARAFLALGAASDVAYGTAYNSGTGRAVTIEDTVTAVRVICGSDKPVVTEKKRTRPENSEVRALIADPRALNLATGWRATHSLEQGLSLSIEWWRERLSAGKVRLGLEYMT